MERFERKINPKNHTTYYEAKLTLKLRIKGMHMTGEVWWYGLRMDSVEIKDIDKVPAQ